MDERERLNLEILGLLLQLAWADHEISSAEAEKIIDRAREMNIGADHVERLQGCLRGDSTLPPPDMGFLRAHRDTVIDAVESFVGPGEQGGDDTADADAESELLAEIKVLLG